MTIANLQSAVYIQHLHYNLQRATVTDRPYTYLTSTTRGAVYCSASEIRAFITWPLEGAFVVVEMAVRS